MPKVQPDFSEVKKFENVPNGQYAVQIHGCEVKQMKDGMPQLNWTLKIIDNPQLNGRTLYMNTPVGGQYAYILQRFLRMANPDYTGGEFDTTDYLGKKLEVAVTNKTNPQTGEESKYPDVRSHSPYVDRGTGSASMADNPFANS